ncbi:MAG TPA: sugar phosphate isomerase/epimerase family protein [Deltaproteobacteria bacterium]|nr:sugar phosphate isomerase/epimerase family protein [Deltaproteobacteria bacterium]
MITIGGRAHTMSEVREVASMGYPFIEVSLDDPESVESWVPELLDIREDTGIVYLAHFPNENDPFDAVRLRKLFVPKIKALIDLSAALGVGKATMHFWMDRRWAPEGLIPRKIELLGEICAYAASSSLTVCIENLSEKADSFQAAFDAIPTLRMTLDIGHGELLSRENTSYGFIERFMDRIAHVHVHDNKGGTSVHDDLHLCLGDGRVDFPAILAALVDRGYDSTITMEVKPSDMRRTLDAIIRCIPGASGGVRSRP